jgi:hypothetical protein
MGRWAGRSGALRPFIATPIASTLTPKEESMYLGVFFVYAIIFVLASPLIWVAWWLLADLGERAEGSYTRVHYVPTSESHRRAA